MIVLIENAVKVGIPEFLNGVGRGLQNHVEKLESEIGDLNKLLVTRTLKLKRLGIPCKDVRQIHFFYVLIHVYILGCAFGNVSFGIVCSQLMVCCGT